MILVLVLVILLGGTGYYGATSCSRKTKPCPKCAAEGYRRAIFSLYRQCRRCGGTREVPKYAAARHRARRAMRAVKA
jgi:hypothetical protein